LRGREGSRASHPSRRDERRRALKGEGDHATGSSAGLSRATSRSCVSPRLVIELIRARPAGWWSGSWVLLQAAALADGCRCCFMQVPPGDLATVLAYGREYQVRPPSSARPLLVLARRHRIFAPPAIMCSASMCCRSFARLLTFLDALSARGAPIVGKPAGGACSAVDRDDHDLQFATGPRVLARWSRARPPLGTAPPALLAS